MAGDPRRPTSGRRGASLLVKIMACLAVCLVLASVLTAAFGTRLTRAALRRESEKQVRGNLAELSVAYAEYQVGLVRETANLAGVVTRGQLTDPSRRGLLGFALDDPARTFHFDVVDIADEDGQRLPVPGGSIHLDDLPGAVRDYRTFNAITAWTSAGTGGPVQVVVSAVGSGPHRLILVAGTAFGDGLAGRLKRQIHDRGEVVLVAGGKVVGSTLNPAPPPPQPAPPSPPALPGPLAPRESFAGSRGPAAVTEARLNGRKMLVAYAPVTLADQGVASGAIGVAVVDPTGALDRSLARGRVLASAILSLVVVALGWLLFRALIRPLAALDRTATRIAAGDLEASFAVKGHDEIARLGHSLARMTEESRAQARRVADTSRRIVTAQDDERRRMERNLHDGAQQRLLTASLAVGVAKASRAARDDPALAATLDEVTRHLDSALAELRELARGIHPAILSEAGLGPALESLAEKSLVPATVEEPFTPRLAAPIEATAYFVVSEALVNATKHARSSAVTIQATLNGKGLVVVVSDDGVGGADPSHGSGLRGLSDRLAALGGTLTIDSPAGGGTRIVAELPCG